MAQKIEKHLGLHIAAKVQMALPRESYKMLLVLNYRGFASRISRGSSDQKKSIEAAWYNVGGDIDNLWTNLNKGKNKKPLMCGKNCKDKIPADAKVSADGMMVNDVEEYYYPSIFYDEPKLRNRSSNYWMLRVNADGTEASVFGDSMSAPGDYTVESTPFNPTAMLLDKKQKYQPIKHDSTCWFNCVDTVSTVACVAATAVPIILALSQIVNSITAKPDETDNLGSNTTAALDSTGGYVPPIVPIGTVSPQAQQQVENIGANTHKTAIIAVAVIGGLLVTALAISAFSKK